MQPSAILLLATLGGFVSAAPSRERDVSVGKWTLQSIGRLCDDDTQQCSIHFLLREDEGGISQLCTFDITGPKGQPAERTAFFNQKCNETDKYRVNSGWDRQGFTVLTIINEPEGKLAYFGFRDEELANNKQAGPVTSDIFEYRAGHKGRKREGPIRVAARDDKSLAALEKATSWTLKDMYRGKHFSKLKWPLADGVDTQSPPMTA